MSLLFHTKWLIHSWNITISKFYPENPKIQCQVMVEVKVQDCMVGPTLYLTHISFVQCWSTLPFLRYSFFKIWRSRSWMRSKFQATKWVRLLIDSNPFHSRSIGHPIPGIQLFQYLNLKVQGQGHSSRSHSGSDILLTHITSFHFN